MKKFLYKIDFILQKILTSLFFSFPILSLLKKLYFGLRLKTFIPVIGYDIIITNFDKTNKKSGIKFLGKCTLSRNIEIDTSGGLTIGNHVTISDNVRIQTHRHEFDKVSLFQNKTNTSHLTIDSEVWICNNVIITESVNKIGKGAIIGTGAVLTKDVKPFSIVGGIPAKHIRYRKKF